MRNLVRRQFTSDTRASLRDWMAEREQEVVEHKTAPATEYAGVPLLNPQQVALVWQQNIARGNRWDTQTFEPSYDQMYVDEIEHFFACVDGRERPRVDLRAGYHVQRILDACNRSSATGRWVALD